MQTECQRVSLRLSGAWANLKDHQILTLTQLLSSLTAMETLSITADMDSAELWESLRGLNIKSLSLKGTQGRLKVEYIAWLSQSLSTLTQPETLIMNANTYSDIHLTQSLKSINFSYERLFPWELRELVNKLIELNQIIQCILEFDCSRRIDEYITIKQELDEMTHVEVNRLRIYHRSRDTYMENTEYTISMKLLINCD
ncbi:hypothetical protein DPMN_097051 [Dreissena polymorpha]|uniref:Uncharacterized protein n=1 Tax=Dreissena polymorpha TaxID=45954 RepID=A0A9D4LAZ9_DREPO|nr:hypothetical protein DPMN_097051 [Dreissena polymorpha]